MKTTAITLTALLLSMSLMAQVKQGFEVETQGGYEYNYFKSPGEVRRKEITFTKKDLIESSVYQDFMLDYDYSKKWGRNRIRFSVSPSVRLFYENFEDSYWSLIASAKYDYSLSQKTKLFGEASFKRMNREGLDGAQDVLINPLGYTNYNAAAGGKFRPFRKNKTTIEAFYNFKDFDEFGVRDLQFDEFGIQLKTEQKFKVNNLNHKYGLVAYVKKRKYDTFNASEIIADGVRDWSYAKATVFYECSISKTLEVEPGFAYYVRIDNGANRSGFKQFGPAIGLKFDDNKTMLRATLKYLTRNYTSIEARDNDGLIGEKIQYNYADIKVDAAHRLDHSISLTATVYSRIRSTNYTDIEARSFRGYRNLYAGLGVKWEF